MKKAIETMIIIAMWVGLIVCSKEPPRPDPDDQHTSGPALVPAPAPAPVPPSEMKLTAAGQYGNASVQITGLDVSRMQVMITSGRAMTITIPVGTPFTSAAGGTQNMMAASTTEIAIVAGETKTTEIEVYCVNRFRDAPTKDSQFRSSDADPDSPLTKLSACLVQKGADHQTRQLAIWLVSDGLKDKARAEVVREFVKHTEEELAAEGADHLDYVLAMALKSGYSDDELKALHDKYSTPEKKEEVDQMFESAMEEDVKQYADRGGPLLAQCGYDTSSLAFFQ